MKFRKHIILYLTLMKLGYAGTVTELIDYQLYKDFAMNKGQFKVGATNVVVKRKDGTFKVIDKPIPDFSSTDSIAVGTLIDPNYVAGVKHNKGYKTVTYGYNTGHTYKLIDRNEKDGRDYHTPRLNKVVTDVAPTKYKQDDTLVQDWKNKYSMFARVGSGNQYIQDKDGNKIKVSGAYNYLTGGIISSDMLYKGIWVDDREGNLNISLDKSPLPIYIEAGDSGSPLWGFNNETQEWELVAFAMAITNTSSIYIPVDRAFMETVMKEDYLPEIKDTGKSEEIIWNGTKIEEGSNQGVGTIVQGENEWNYNGLKSELELSKATDEELNSTKHLVFNGVGGDIKLKDSINMGAGKLWFKNDYTLKGETGKETWVGAGIEIDKDKTVLWQVNGVKDDALHKIGEGTLHINATGINQGSLNVGDGTVILDQQADERGNKQAFESIDIVSGRATVVLNSADQIDTSKINFLFRGGRLDINGNDIAFGDINAVDYGAHIINRADEKATISIDIDKFKGDTSIYHGQFGESDEKKVNGELDVNIGGVSGEKKTFAITGGSNLKGDFNLTSGDTTLILSGGRDLHAGEDIKKTTVNGDYYFSEFNYENINMAEGSELYGSIYSVMNGNINTEGDSRVVLGYVDGESKVVYDSTQETKEQTATEMILNDEENGDRFNQITTFYNGDINLQNNSTLKSGYTQLEGNIHSNNSKISLYESIVTGDIKLKNNSDLVTEKLFMYGNLNVEKSSANISNTNIIGEISGDKESEVSLTNSTWIATNDSEISKLNLDNSHISFTNNELSKDSSSFHNIKVDELTGNGGVHFRTDLETGLSDKLIIDKLYGDDVKLNVDIENIGQDIAYGEKITFLEIHNNDTQNLEVKSYDGKSYVEVGPVRVDIIITDNQGGVGSNLLDKPPVKPEPEIPTDPSEPESPDIEIGGSIPENINKGNASSLGNATLGDFSARFSLIKSQRELIDEAMAGIEKDNFTSGVRYRGNYSDSKYENDKFREYEQTILNHGITYEIEEVLNEKWDLYKGVAFIYGKSNIDYEGDYSGDMESYSGQVYAKAISDDGYFIKWNSGASYIKGSMNSEDYNTYSLNAGAGIGIVKNIYDLNVITGVELNLYYMPSYDYKINGWQVDGRDSMISQITPKVRVKKDFYLNEFKFTTYGETNIDYNFYLNGDEPEVEIAKADISTGIIEKGLNIKGGVDGEYRNISVGLELNHFTGKYNSEKTTASFKTTLKF